MKRTQHGFIFTIAAVATLLICAAPAYCNKVLVSQSDGFLGYGYGFDAWDNFTTALKTATGNQVTVVPNFNNLAQMLSFDAIMLDQRGNAGTLGAGEAANIGTFAATGRRVLMMGENHYWTDWDNQILAIVGGSYAGESTSTATRLVINNITDGAPTLSPTFAGIAAGGTALYSPNIATLWRAPQNVLTVLDINIWEDSFWATQNGGVFGTNVANWLASGPQVPEPCGILLAAIGAAASLVVARRR